MVDKVIAALDKGQFLGRTIGAQRSKVKDQIVQKSANAVVVTNLSYSVRQETLAKFLESTFGPTASVNLVLDDHQRSKGFAFVEFGTAEACERALSAREFKLEGRLALVKQSNRQVTQKKRKPL